MSGSGNGNSGSGFPTTDASTCESLAFDTQLASPRPDVVDQINPGDVLMIATHQQGTTTVVVALHSGEVAGGIASPRVNQLRECLAQGFEFFATVTTIDSGQVRVRVAISKN